MCVRVRVRACVCQASDLFHFSMLHNHASVLLDDDEDTTNDDDDDEVRVLVVGGGGNCFSFGTHFNRHLTMLTLRSNRRRNGDPLTGALCPVYHI